MKSVWSDPELGKSGPFDPGDYERQLLEDLSYKECAGRVLKVPKGYVGNGASVPRPLWTVLGYTPGDGKLERSAFLHDWMTGEPQFTTARANVTFHEALKSDGLSERMAQAFYVAVEAAGFQRATVGGELKPRSFGAKAYRAIELLVDLYVRGLTVAKTVTAGMTKREGNKILVHSIERYTARPANRTGRPNAEEIAALKATLSELSEDQLAQLKSEGTTATTRIRTRELR